MKQKCIIFTVVLVLLQFFCTSVLAKPTTSYQAEKVVTGWLSAAAQPLGTALGQQVTKVETFTNDEREPLYYIVYLEPTGFVIVSADDLVEPIIGFADDQTYDPSPENPLRALVTKDLNGRIAAVRNIQGIQSADEMEAAMESQDKWEQLESLAEVYTIMGVNDINDVRVSPLVESKWGQTTCCNSPALACYNYYTPLSDPCDPCDKAVSSSPGSPNPYGSFNNYPCGCVATAMAQLMFYHRHPSTVIPKQLIPITVNGQQEIAWLRGSDGQGGAYKWSDMVNEPNCSTSQASRQAIGALCYDAGISVYMHYTPSVSSSLLWDATNALRVPHLFNYYNAVYASSPTTGKPLYNMINTNLDCNQPVMLGIRDSITDESHAVLTDGYGYQFSTPYHHINMGWSGQDDAWYNLPTILNYTVIDDCVYNISISNSGEIISGRLLYPWGNPIVGVTVTAQGPSRSYSALTNSNGIYALTNLPSNTTFTVSAQQNLGFHFHSRTVMTGGSADYNSTSGNIWGIDLEPYLPIYANDDAPGDPGPGDPTVSDPEENGTIEHPYDAIQEGIDSAEEGDTVIVLTGTYTGPGNNDIDFKGKAITVRSSDPDNSSVVAETIVDCEASPSNPAFYFGKDPNLGVGPNTVLAGLTIINSNTDNGGGIYCINSSPTIANCTFSNNYADYGGAIRDYNSSPVLTNCTFIGNSANRGGGIYNDNSNPTLTNCTFLGNLAAWDSGGMYNYYSSPTLTNCIFSGNSAVLWYGGGMYNEYDSSPTLNNCTFSGNSASNYGGGICSYCNSNATLANCILWGNTASEGPQIAVIDAYSSCPSNVTISYSDTQGGDAAAYTDSGCAIIWVGDNIDDDPTFMDAIGPDATAGTEDDNLRLWEGSACIDAGDNTSVTVDTVDLDGDGNTAEPTPQDLDGRLRFADGDCNDTDMVDMGAYEFAYAYIGDFDGQCDVDFEDFAWFALAWLTAYDQAQYNSACDISIPADEYINWRDLDVFTDNWLAGETTVRTEHWAVIVGISDYNAISDMNFCDEDATDWYNYFVDLGYENIWVFGDGNTGDYPQYDGLATESNIKASLVNMINKAGPDDIIAFIFSGHGGTSVIGNSYLAAWDSEAAQNGQDGDLYDYELKVILESAVADRIFVFLDSCHSGGMGDNLMAMSNAPNVYATTTCGQNGCSGEEPAYSNGAWNYWFVEDGLINHFTSEPNTRMEECFVWADSQYNPGGDDEPQEFDGNSGEAFTLW